MWVLYVALLKRRGEGEREGGSCAGVEVGRGKALRPRRTVSELTARVPVSVMASASSQSIGTGIVERRNEILYSWRRYRGKEEQTEEGDVTRKHAMRAGRDWGGEDCLFRRGRAGSGHCRPRSILALPKDS